MANLGGKIALSVRLLDNLGYLPKTGSTHGNGPAAVTEAMAPDARRTGPTGPTPGNGPYGPRPDRGGLGRHGQTGL
ncbi:MAG: hypothetical protein R2857_14420 [Vampirovibrionales bacterium]